MQFELCPKNHTLPNSQDSAASPEVKQSPKPAEEMESSVAGRKAMYPLVPGEALKDRRKRLRHEHYERLKSPGWKPSRRSRNSAFTKEDITSRVSIDPVTGCWNWLKGKTTAGYGILNHFGKSCYAHRKAYELWTGNSLDGLEACHSCDRPGCCSPYHIFPGTHQANLKDAKLKGRLRKKLSDENIRSIRSDTRTLRVIASDYNVCHKTIIQVKRRKIYDWVK